MKFLFGLLLLSISAIAAETSTTGHYANINKGNVETSGGITFSQSLGKNNDRANYLDASLGLKYFFLDRLSAGGLFSYEHATGSDDLALVGPAVQYHFWTQERLASYVGMSYQFGLTNSTIKGRLQGTLGIDYFVTPSVSLGPWIAYRHMVERGNASDYDRLLFGASLGINL